MKRILSTVAVLALFTAPALAQFTDYTATPLGGTVIWRNGQTVPDTRGTIFPNANAKYSNISDTGFSGQVIGSTTAQNQSGNGITSMIMDDLQMTGVVPGGDVTEVWFTVFNGNTSTVSVRPRIRFWFDDGSIPGAPGNFYNVPGPGAIGFSAGAPIAFDGNSITRYGFGIAAGVFKLNSNIKMWAGLTFDNNNGTSGATLNQLVNFGQGLWDANAEVGSSDPNNAYETTAAGSFLGVNAPAGLNLDFGYDGTPLGGPAANFGWEISQVPEPATMALIGLGALGLIRRRR